MTEVKKIYLNGNGYVQNLLGKKFNAAGHSLYEMKFINYKPTIRKTSNSIPNWEYKIIGIAYSNSDYYVVYDRGVAELIGYAKLSDIILLGGVVKHLICLIYLAERQVA